METLQDLYWEMLSIHGPLYTHQIAKRIGKPRNTVCSSLRAMRVLGYVDSTGDAKGSDPFIWTARNRPVAKPHKLRKNHQAKSNLPPFGIGHRELNVLATMRRVQL